MEFKNTIEALQTNADEIVRLLSSLKGPKGVTRIDVDLVLDKLRSMYDLMLDIQSTVGPANIQTKPDQGQVKEENADAEPQQRKRQMVIDIDEFKEIPEEPKEEISTNTDKTDEERLLERKQTVKANIEQDLKKEKEEQKEAEGKKSVISDRFKSKPTLAEELSGKKKVDDLASQLKTQGVPGISSSFGINEKFEIISELFGGDKEKFEYTLQVASKAGSFVEAYNYLKENFSWDMDNLHVQRLLEQIRRKLIVQRKDE